MAVETGARDWNLRPVIYSKGKCVLELKAQPCGGAAAGSEVELVMSCAVQEAPVPVPGRRAHGGEAGFKEKGDNINRMFGSRPCPQAWSLIQNWKSLVRGMQSGTQILDKVGLAKDAWGSRGARLVVLISHEL